MTNIITNTNLNNAIPFLEAALQNKAELANPVAYMNFQKKLAKCQLALNAVALSSDKGMVDLLQKRLDGIQQQMPVVLSSIGIDPRSALTRIVDLLKRHKRGKALAEFSIFEKNFPKLAGEVYKNLWKLKGSPLNKGAEFGKEAFHQKNRFSSLNCEKAEAITLLYSPVTARLQEIAHLFRSNPQNVLPLLNELIAVYPKTLADIYGKIWEVYGRPTHTSAPLIAHEEFGKIALHNYHPSPYFKPNFALHAQAIEQFLPLLVFSKEDNKERRDLRTLAVIEENLPRLLQEKEKYKAAIQNTVIYRDGGTTAPKSPRFAQMEMTVLPLNCIRVAYDLAQDEKNHVYVLNFANAHVPGGRYFKGGGSQEEELFYCTPLPLVLDKRHGLQQQNFYPHVTHCGKGGGTYSPNVPILRMGSEEDYRLLEEKHPEIGVGTFAAFHNPSLDFRDKANPRLQGEQLHWTREKIRTCLKAAYDHGHDVLILGAFGAGAFANPPQHIAELFLDVLAKEYPGCFKKIVFSILKDEHNHAHNPEGNFLPFARLVKQQGGTVHE